LVSVISACANGLQAGVDMLASAPISMMDPLDNFYPQGSASRDLMMRLCSQMRGFADHVRSGDRQIQAVHQVLQDVQAQNAAVHKTFQGRDTIYTTHMHYSGKVERLQEQLSRNPQNSRLAEKLNRNVQKKNEHQVAFQDAMGEVTKSVPAILEQKQSRISEALAKLCEYYAVVFEAAARLVKDFAEVGDLLVVQSSSEAHLRKGQELQAKAQQMRSSFGPGGGHTAASAGGTDGYPVDARRHAGGSSGGGGYGQPWPQADGSSACAAAGAGDNSSSRRRKSQEGAPFMNSVGSQPYTAYAAGDSAGGPSNAGWTNSAPVNTWPGTSGNENSGAPWAAACAQHAFSVKGGAAPVAQAAAAQAMRDPWAAQTAARSVPASRTPWA